MGGGVIELNAAAFWILCAGAVALLVPVSAARPRKWILAAVNLTFLASLLGRDAVGLAAGILAAYLLLQGTARATWRVISAALTSVLLITLFVLHKLPPATTHVAGPLGRALSLIGYSYVALRMVEVLRAVFEGRHAAPALPDFVNYLLPFHMLAAGPIQAYDDFVRQPAEPAALAALDVLIAAERIAGGLFKKFVLASILQKIFLTDFQAHGWYFVLELQVFFVWLFLDFSAYSDIAVGIGILLGIQTPENFNRPLLARNMVEFWERWHISLSLFIRRNLFIPLQLFFMRRTDGGAPLLCAIGAIVLSFLLCGLWHGLTAGFLIWGLAQASGLAAVRIYAHVLQRRIGTKRLKVYLANPWIRALAVVVTFEFEACTLLTLFIA